MPVDRGAIDAQLREIGEGEHWWELREFRTLPHVLEAEERIRGLVLGKLLLSRRPRLRPARRWLVVATDERLLCILQERYARRQVEVRRDQISRLEHGPRVRSYQILVESAGRRVRIRIPKKDAVRFSAALTPLAPQNALAPLPPEVESLAWIPGLTTVATLPGFSGIVSKVARLSPPAPPAPGRIEQLEAAVDQLQADVERLQQQVEFLEKLLDQRSSEAMLHARSPLPETSLKTRP
ncbi:MAG TPA: hypothetical protein VF167_08955 [Longimicrobiaceae bacterium]